MLFQNKHRQNFECKVPFLNDHQNRGDSQTKEIVKKPKRSDIIFFKFLNMISKDVKTKKILRSSNYSKKNTENLQGRIKLGQLKVILPRRRGLQMNRNYSTHLS